MTAEKKIAHHRLTLLQVAERIRNVSEACFATGYLGDLQMVMVKSEIGY